MLNHFHLTSLSTAVEKKMATRVSLSLCNLFPMEWVDLHTFNEGFDALGKVGVPRYVLPIRGNLKCRERKEFRFLEGRTGQNDATSTTPVLASFPGPAQFSVTSTSRAWKRGYPGP